MDLEKVVVPEVEFNDEQNERPDKGILPFVVKIIMGVFLFFAVALIALAVTQEDGAPPRSFGGYSVTRVLTGSMYPELPIGTMILIGPVDEQAIEVGSIITFVRGDARVISHRVVEIYHNYNETGRPGFITRGDAVATRDPEVVRAENVLGQVIWTSSLFGGVITFVERQPVLIFIGTGAVVVGIAILVVKNKSSE